ncbi:hypothetical protein ACFYXH_42010 [Streptomyces sp. NPDC002730]|uniref:hypothetical protein n=1 Tax=Streptomyces sp. NPDC002730 TaxID=3364662 RepID=UPI0036B660C0
MAFDDAGGPGKGEVGGDSGKVLTEKAGEATDGLRLVLLCLANPLRQEHAALMAGHLKKGPGIEERGPM